MHADYIKGEDTAVKDDDHVGDTEVSGEDGRAQPADKARGVHNYELLAESRCRVRCRIGGGNKRNRVLVEEKCVFQVMSHCIGLKVK